MRWRLSGPLIASLVLAWAPNLVAQQRDVSGTVTRADDGRPIQDALVTVVGGRLTQVRTGANGGYTISVPAASSASVARSRRALNAE